MDARAYLRAYLNDLEDELADCKRRSRNCGKEAAPVFAEEIAMIKRDVSIIGQKLRTLQEGR